MERAHVLIRLRGADALEQQQQQQQQQQQRRPDGVTRTSATTVRLEHSDMSPGVASITFEQVFDEHHTSADIFAQSLAPAVARCVQGFSTSLVFAGASRAGKSFACHGDRQQNVTGVSTLALRHVFKELERLRAAEPATAYQVLLACVHVTATGELVDLLQPSNATASSPFDGDTDCMLLQHSVAVATSVEAVHVYAQALARSTAAATAADSSSSSCDFALVVHVETQRANESRVRRGRFACIDIHGSAILEPTRSPVADPAASLPHKPVFSDTHFPIAAAASRYFGGLVGNATATYMLVAIHKHAQFQQQAIQSLLYACKAKDIKSVCAITYVSAFTRSSELVMRSASSRDANEQVDDTHDALKRHDRSRPSSPVSATSSDSTSEFLLASSDDTGVERLGPMRTDTAAAPLLQSQQVRHALLAQRLRHAYDSVKSTASDGPTNTVVSTTNEPPRAKYERFEGLFAAKTSLLHAKADTMLSAATAHDNGSNNELEALSLLDKLERIDAITTATARALAHETNVKDKCVERIAKLSQAIGSQATEHAVQLQDARAETDRVRAQLEATERKFEAVSIEVAQLQQHVAALKTATLLPAAPAWSEASTVLAPATVSTGLDRERALLQHLSTRLETAMDEAKAVVDYKNCAIRELESQLAAADARVAVAAATLQQRIETSERAAAAAQQENDALRARVADLTTEVATLQQQALTSQTDSDNDTVSSQQQALDDRLAVKTREWIAAHAANAANCRHIARLETRNAAVVRQFERTKRKMDKRAKALASDCRALRVAVTQQTNVAQQRDDELRDALAQQQQRHERSDAMLRAEVEQLTQATAALELECLEIQQQLDAARTESCKLVSERDAAVAACEQQVAMLEQTLAQQQCELTAEHERSMRELVDRHAAELHARDVAATAAVMSSTSSSSSQPSSSHSPGRLAAERSDAPDTSASQLPSPLKRQQSIDDLDALIDSKERQYARAQSDPVRSDRKQQLQRPESATRHVVDLERRLRDLTHALAVANEQETLAKAQLQRLADVQQSSASDRDCLLAEMNRLKHENWSLSLALEVTERR